MHFVQPLGTASSISLFVRSMRQLCPRLQMAGSVAAVDSTAPPCPCPRVETCSGPKPPATRAWRAPATTPAGKASTARLSEAVVFGRSGF